MANDKTQGIIKCGRGEGGFQYKGHYRAEIFFDPHGREFIVDDKSTASVKNGIVDEPGKPLLLSAKTYEYLREANGKALMFEPWDGQPRPAPVEARKALPIDERVAKLEDGQTEIRGMLQQLLEKLKK